MASVSMASPYDSSTWGYLNQSNIEALVSTAMTYMKSEVDELETKVGDLTTNRAIVSDLSGYLKSLDSASESLAGLDSTNSFYVADTVTPGDAGVITGSVTGSATAGEYDIDVTSLAHAHSIGSKQYTKASVALGLEGTFYIGGLAAAQTSDATTDTSVTAYGTADLGEDLTQLGSGEYYVEYRQSEGAWQFRVVDSTGDAVAVKKADGSDGTTESWQSFSTVAGTTFDTGRGLTVTFGAEPTAAKSFDDPSPIGVTYAAKGAQVTVEATDTLADIKSHINSATYADGNAVRATIVSGRLVITSANTGTAYQIKGGDSTGTVLQSLELFGADGSVTHELTAASDAVFTINDSITITRSRNSNLSDVIEGVSLTLRGQGSTTLSVSASVSNAEKKVQSFVTTFNTALNYLRAKTSVSLSTGSTSTSDTPTYTRGALAGDSVFTSLKQKMYSTVIARYGSGTLSDLGISINSSSMTLEISDASKLTDALENDPEGTKALLADIAKAVNAAVDPYAENENDNIMTNRLKAMDANIEDLNGDIEDKNDKIDAKTESLRNQYYALQSLYLKSLYSLMEWQVQSGSYSNNSG